MCCIICIDWEKGKLTDKEAIGALGEMVISTSDEEETDHFWETSRKIMDKIHKDKNEKI